MNQSSSQAIVMRECIRVLQDGALLISEESEGQDSVESDSDSQDNSRSQELNDNNIRVKHTLSGLIKLYSAKPRLRKRSSKISETGNIGWEDLSSSGKKSAE